MAPPWGKFLYGGKGGPLQKGVILGNLGGSAPPPHGDLPATGLFGGSSHNHQPMKIHGLYDRFGGQLDLNSHAV